MSNLRTKEQILDQLDSLIDDRLSFITNKNEEEDNIFKEDLICLNHARSIVSMYEFETIETKKEGK